MLLAIHCGMMLVFLLLGLVFSRGKGAFLIAGYNTAPKQEKKALSWMAKGAQPTDTVKNLFSKGGIMKKYAESKAK